MISEVTRARLQEAARRRWAKPGHRELISQLATGRRHSDESREAMRRAVRKARFSDVDTRFDAKWAAVPSGCWVWVGSKFSKGYGQFRVGEKRICAHRFSWERAHGAIPPGLQLDHLCRNTSCVNPDHLEPVTQSVNMRRAFASKAV